MFLHENLVCHLFHYGIFFVYFFVANISKANLQKTLRILKSLGSRLCLVLKNIFE